MKLAYLADIYQHLNNLNTACRVLPQTNFLHLEKAPFKRKRRNVSTPTSNSDWIWKCHSINYKSYRITVKKLDKYFRSLPSNTYDWVRNPFTEFSPSTENLFSLKEEEELSELQCHRTLKIKCNEVSLDKFWISARQEYPVISVKALDVLLQFSTSYLYEQAFSCLTVIKSKSRNSLLSVEEELRVCLSKFRLRIS